MKYICKISLLLFNDPSDSTYPDVRRYKGGAWERRMGESWESDYDDELEIEYRRMVDLGLCPDMDAVSSDVRIQSSPSCGVPESTRADG